MFFMRKLMVRLGSEYNGINATATQISNALLVIEGGFSLASLVALYNPFTKKDFEKVNRIIGHSQRVFLKMAIGIFAAGMVTSVVFAFFMKTQVPTLEVIAIFALTIATIAYRIMVTNALRLMFQVAQTEYYMHATHLITNALIYLVMIVLLDQGYGLVVVKVVHLLGTVLDSIILLLIHRKKFAFIGRLRFQGREAIEGTRDVFWAKLTGLIYSSAPTFFLSLFVGAAATSVYAVYNSVMALLAGVLAALLAAPQSALGQIVSENDERRLATAFKEYEAIAFVMISVALTTVFPIIIPFVKIFTFGVHDTNYVYPVYAVLLSLSALAQFVHIPSGTGLNLTGNFGIVKRIQVSACLLLLVLTVIGALTWQTVGILLAQLIANLYLAVVEIISVRRYVLQRQVGGMALRLIGIAVGVVVIAYVEYIVIDLLTIESLIHLFVVASALLLVNALLVLLLFAILDRNVIVLLKNRLLALKR